MRNLLADPSRQQPASPLRAWMIAAALLVPAAVFAPGLAAPLSLQDDYEIPVLAGRVGPSTSAAEALAERIRNDAQANGRFRPLFYVLRVAQARLIGVHPFLLHITPLAMLLASLCILIAVGRSLGMNAWPAILLSWLVVLNPRGKEIWWMLVLQESAGILCISVSLLAMVRGAMSTRRWLWDVVGVVFAIMAVLAKEPFVLTLPALAAARVGAEVVLARASWSAAFRRSMPLVIVLSLASAAELMAVRSVVAAGTFSSSLMQRSSLWSGAWRVAGNLWDSSFYLLPAACFVAMCLWKRWVRDKHLRMAAMAVGVAALIWIVPTGALQAAVGGAHARYIFPMALAAAVANAAAFACLRARATKRVRWALDLAAIAWLVHCAVQCNAGVWKFTSEAQMAGDAIASVTRDVKPGGKVLLVADVAKQVEPANSMAYLIASSGRQDIRVDVLDVPGSAPKDAGEAAAREEIRAKARELLHIVPSAEMDDYEAILAAQPIGPVPQAVVATIPSGFKPLNFERQYREAFHFYSRKLQTTVYIRN